MRSSTGLTEGHNLRLPVLRSVDVQLRGEWLRRLREHYYSHLKYRRDPLFELCDAMLSTGYFVGAPVNLSLAPVHRPGWGSLYAALNEGRINEEALRDLLAHHPLVRGVSSCENLRVVQSFRLATLGGRP